MSKMCGVMPATSKTSSGIAVASDPAVFSYCAATLLLCDAHVSVHSMLIETDSERDLFIKVDQSDEISRLMQEFDSQGRLRSTNLRLEFCDRAPPASMCKTALATFSISHSSSGMLMLMNDGRIVSPLALLRSACAPSAVNTLRKKQSSGPPEWLRPPHTSDYCQFHQNCTALAIEGFTSGAKHGITMRGGAHTAPEVTVARGSVATTSDIAAATPVVSHLNPSSSVLGNELASPVPAFPLVSTDSIVSTAQMHIASLNLSSDTTPVQVPAPILVLDFEHTGDSADASAAADAASHCENWLNLMKRLKKSMEKNNVYPLPVCARGISLHGHVQSSGSKGPHPVLISLTTEGMLHQQHMQLWSRSCVTPVGDFSINVTNALASANVPPSHSSCDFSITFKKVEHRDSCLRIMQHMIASFDKAELQVTSRLSSIEENLKSQSSELLAGGLSRPLLTLLSPTQSPVLDVLNFPYDGPSPPILQKLVCTIRTLYEDDPDAILQKVERNVPSRREHVMRMICARPLHLLIQSCWGSDVQARAVYWLISAVAAAAPAALHVKNCRDDDNHDDDGEMQECTLLQALIFSKKNSSTSIRRDHDFESQALQMLLRADPSLASDPVSDHFGETVFSRICSSLNDASSLFYRDAYHTLHCLLQACPSLVSQNIPSQLNQLPLHLLCAGDPKPHELQLLLDAYPAAATACDDNGHLPIHALVQSTSSPECISIMFAAAPDCMMHHANLGYYPLHLLSNEGLKLKGRKAERVLATLIRGCHCQIICDSAPSACSVVLQQLNKWAVMGSACEHYGIVREMSILDIG